MKTDIEIEGRRITISNPEKIMWPDAGIRKIDYIKTMVGMARHIMTHSRNRLLTSIRYPDGIRGKSFYQKNIPDYAPDWVETKWFNNIQYILLDSVPTLIWLANLAVLEYHTSFNLVDHPDNPSSLVFDLDPSEGQPLDDVIECTLLIYDTLKSLGIRSWIKTSGATGLQIYIPTGSRYTYQTARKINLFFGRYFSQRFSDRITIERQVDRRDKKLYFDYLQMWYGKTITMPYSPRAVPSAAVSMPIAWDELVKGIKAEDFTLLNARERLDDKGDIFADLYDNSNYQNLDLIIQSLTDE